MLDLMLRRADGRAPEVLFLGAHSDDIEIGCGATAARIAECYPEARITWIVLSAPGGREEEARAAARRLMAPAKRVEVRVAHFRESYFPWEGAAIKEYFESFRGAVSPDVVLTHAREDLHQDHRVVSELSWNTFRNHLILEYEIPKFDGNPGAPNVFVPASDRHRAAKIECLMECFGSQRAKPWFTPETFQGLMRLRGIECNAPDGHAEAFTARKLVLAV